MDGPRVTLEGDVDISQGPRLLHAQRMAYDQQSEVAELEGDVMIRQPGLLVRGTGARVNMAGNEARFEGGEFVMHGSHMRGSAERIDHRASGLVVLDNGTITSCEPYREAWRIRGERLSVNPVSRRLFVRQLLAQGRTTSNSIVSIHALVKSAIATIQDMRSKLVVSIHALVKSAMTTRPVD